MRHGQAASQSARGRQRRAGTRQSAGQNREISISDQAEAEQDFRVALGYIKDGETRKAQMRLEGLLGQYPDYVAALFELSRIHIGREEFGPAADYLARAAMHNPWDERVQTNLAACYFKLGADDMAEIVYRQLIDLNPSYAETYFNLGQLYGRLRDYGRCEAALLKALDLRPDYYDAMTALGACYEHLGQLAESYRTYLAATKIGGDRLLDAVGGLAGLPAALVEIDLMALLDRAAATVDPDDEADAGIIASARARILAHQGKHDAAWSEAAALNNRYRDRLAAQRAGDEKAYRLTMEWARELKKIPVTPVPEVEEDVTSLFILGPSRSGKTTLERLLATLDDTVKPGYENVVVRSLARRTNLVAGRLGINNVAALPVGLHAHFTRFYRQELARRSDGRKVYTTTTPGMIQDVPRLVTLVPKAKFIFLRRDVDDLAVRIFFSFYRSGNSYGYDMKTITEYVSWYYQLIDLWCELFPGSTLVVDYETLVEDPASVWERVLDFCSLAGEYPSSMIVGDDRGAATPYRSLIDADR